MGLINIFKPLSSCQPHWLTSATSIIFRLKIFAKARNRTRDCWMRSKHAASLLCYLYPMLCYLYAMLPLCFATSMQCYLNAMLPLCNATSMICYLYAMMPPYNTSLHKNWIVKIQRRVQTNQSSLRRFVPTWNKCRKCDAKFKFFFYLVEPLHCSWLGRETAARSMSWSLTQVLRPNDWRCDQTLEKEFFSFWSPGVKGSPCPWNVDRSPS